MSAPFNAQDALPGALEALQLSLTPAAQAQLLAHLGLIAKWNRVYNLTAVRDPEEMFTHHLLDSLAVVKPLEAYLMSGDGPGLAGSEAGHGAGHDARHDAAREHGEAFVQGGRPTRAPIRILDVGAGAGLPGVTLAIALPEVLAGSLVEVTCVDAVAKKAGFIRQVAAELGLGSLQATHGRIESLRLPLMEVITCRAFSSLSDMVRLTEQHLAPGGVWMALKGVTPKAEMAELPSGIEVFHVEPLVVPQLNAQRCLVWLRRRASVAE